MELFSNCLVVLAFNSIILYVYQQNCFLISLYTNVMSQLKSNVIYQNTLNCFTKIEYSDASSQVASSQILKDNYEINESKRSENLSIEKIQLNNKLKMLEFILTFEMHLDQNKVDRNRFNEFNEFNELKLSAQRSILESTKKVSILSAA